MAPIEPLAALRARHRQEEHALLAAALASAGSVQGAARALGIGRTALYRLLERHHPELLAALPAAATGRPRVTKVVTAGDKLCHPT